MIGGASTKKGGSPESDLHIWCNGLGRNGAAVPCPQDLPMASSSPLAPFPCPHYLPNTCYYKALNLVMHYQHLKIMFPTKLPCKSQLFWYLDIDYDYGNGHENPYASGTLPSKIYSGIGIGNLRKLYQYNTVEEYGPCRQWCSRTLWIR